MLKTPLDVNYHCMCKVNLIHKEFYKFVHTMWWNRTDNQRVEILLEMEVGKVKEGETTKVKNNHQTIIITKQYSGLCFCQTG